MKQLKWICQYGGMSGGERDVCLNDSNTCKGFSWRVFWAFNPEKKERVAMAL